MKGYDKLTDQLKELFNNTYIRHLESMGYGEREKYANQNIKEIKWDNRERCLKVYFKNGEWYKYFTNGTWG